MAGKESTKDTVAWYEGLQTPEELDFPKEEIAMAETTATSQNKQLSSLHAPILFPVDLTCFLIALDQLDNGEITGRRIIQSRTTPSSLPRCNDGTYPLIIFSDF